MFENVSVSVAGVWVGLCHCERSHTSGSGPGGCVQVSSDYFSTEHRNIGAKIFSRLNSWLINSFMHVFTHSIIHLLILLL